MVFTDYSGIRTTEGFSSELVPALKEKFEQLLNLSEYIETKPIIVSNTAVQKLCLVAGLAQNHTRNKQVLEDLKLVSSGSIHETVFIHDNRSILWSAILKLRYKDTDVDLSNGPIFRRAVSYELLQGAKYLLENNHYSEWMFSQYSHSSRFRNKIPILKLSIGKYVYDDEEESASEMKAELDVNSSAIPNTQIIIAGTTGAGKSNLIALLIQELRKRSIESDYPVNFLLFDYKGEFSDPDNAAWLSEFEVDSSVILNPVEKPLPFNPFKDFTDRPINEINLYATELSTAIRAIDSGAQVSANMSNRLTEAIINAYKKQQQKSITFQQILNAYTLLQPEHEQEKDDSVKSVLKQLIRNSLFDEVDTVNLVKQSFIINLQSFPKDGILARAVVYFIIAKLNTIYEKLPKQITNDDYVEIRHFTVIDEAHYMLNFDNKPLRDLIAVGRNKGLSIILATQNMDAYKSQHFDFYANAYYPLIMKQQSINTTVVKDLFGVAGKELEEIREAISGLQKGELIVKDQEATQLGIGRKFKKIKINKLI